MADLNTNITPAIVVECVTKAKSISTTYDDDITVELDNNPTGATLSGTLVQTAVNGVAVFSDLKLNRSGKNFTIKATGENIRKPQTSARFSITTELQFGAMPSPVQANVAMDPIFVTAVDSAGNTDTNYNGSVTISKYSGPGVLSVVAPNTLTVTAVSGIATFNGLVLSEDGDYFLTATGTEVATAYKPADAVSPQLTVGYVLRITSNTNDYNVRTAFVSAYGAPPASVSLRVIVNPGVTVGATSTATAAMVWGSPWTGTPTFNLVNNGTIRGKDGTNGTNGNGGSEGGGNGQAGTAGGNGGPGLNKSGFTVNVTGTAPQGGSGGTGGIGGGGSGGNVSAGGGTMVLIGGGGAPFGSWNPSSSTNASTQSTAATATVGGNGALRTFINFGPYQVNSGAAGNGGAPGVAGSTGTISTTGPAFPVVGTPGTAGANGANGTNGAAIIP